MGMRATTNCAVAISMHDHVLNTAVFTYGSYSTEWAHEKRCCYQRNKYKIGPATTSVESRSVDIDRILFVSM